MASFSDDEILRYLAKDPPWALGRERAAEMARASKELSAASTGPSLLHTSLGLLDRLPPELLCHALEYLDLQSLAHLSHVSKASKRAVLACSAVCRVRRAGSALVSLARADVLGLHSVATLAAALSSEQCVSCGAFGSHLHLISADRVCTLCLELNRSFSVITVGKAMTGFGLTEQQTRALPSMIDLATWHSNSRQHVTRLVSVQSAREAAVAVYGSMDALNIAHPLRVEDALLLCLYKYAAKRRAPLQPLLRDLPALPAYPEPVTRMDGLRGASPFPVVIDGRVEDGLLCQGCQTTYDRWLYEPFASGYAAPTLRDTLERKLLLKRAKSRTWSRRGLIEHAKQCDSAASLIIRQGQSNH